MDTWRGAWQFKNALHDKNGRRGSSTVQAMTETWAQEAIKDRASQELFGTTCMQCYIVITHLIKVIPKQN